MLSRKEGFMGWQVQSWSLICLLGLTLLKPEPGFAAEKVVFNYGVFQESISLEEFLDFSKNGRISSSLGVVLNSGNPRLNSLVQQALGQEISLDVRLLDKALNHPLGNLFLDQVGEVIRTPSSRANRQALRSAIVLSAAEDSNLSILEIIEKYPTQEVEVEGELLVNLYERIKKFGETLGKLLSP